MLRRSAVPIVTPARAARAHRRLVPHRPGRPGRQERGRVTLLVRVGLGRRRRPDGEVAGLLAFEGEARAALRTEALDHRALEVRGRGPAG